MKNKIHYDSTIIIYYSYNAMINCCFMSYNNIYVIEYGNKLIKRIYEK